MSREMNVFPRGEHFMVEYLMSCRYEGFSWSTAWSVILLWNRLGGNLSTLLTFNVRLGFTPLCCASSFKFKMALQVCFQPWVILDGDTPLLFPRHRF